MKKILTIVAFALLAFSTTSALEPAKVAIVNTSVTPVSVEIQLVDYTGGTPTVKYTQGATAYTPNSSGIIIANISGAGWTAITATSVNSYYMINVLVGGVLTAQYRLDQLILDQSQGGLLDTEGNITPPESGSASLGTDANRWEGAYVTGNTLHVGPADGELNSDELALSYDDGTNTATITVAGSNIITTTATEVTIDGIRVGQGNGNVGSNTAVGINSLTANTIGSSNTAIGANTLPVNIDGSYNTAVGISALFQNIDGSNNTAIGRDALFSNTSGRNNTALGVNSLQTNGSGENNTATGNYSLQNNDTGADNTATGINALFTNVSGGSNAAFGSGALNKSLGNYNAAFGTNSLNNSTGGGNTAVGQAAGYSITSGNNNVFIGVDAGYNGSQKVDPTNSIAIGSQTYTTADNQVVIGNGSITETNLAGNVIPRVTTTSDLGSASNQWRDVYAKGNLILDGIGISVASGSISFGKPIDSHQISETAYGVSAAEGNVGANVIAIGNQAAKSNSQNNVVAIGDNAALSNSGQYVTVVGNGSASGNTGTNVIAIGTGAGASNTGSNVIIMGLGAGFGNTKSNVTIISNSSLPSFVDRAAAVASLAVGAIAGNTYLYYNQTTFAIEAYRP